MNNGNSNSEALEAKAAEGPVSLSEPSQAAGSCVDAAAMSAEEFEALLEYFRTLKRWKEEAEIKKLSHNDKEGSYENT